LINGGSLPVADCFLNPWFAMFVIKPNISLTSGVGVNGTYLREISCSVVIASDSAALILPGAKLVLRTPQ
jgi:hypothetical protein